MKTIDIWRIVSLSSAAERAGIQRGTLEMYRHRHKDFPQPFHKVGNMNLYDWLQIDNWLRLNAPYGRKIMSEEHREKIRQEALRKYDHRLKKFVPLVARESARDERDQEPQSPDGEANRSDEQGHPEQGHEDGVAV